MRCSLPVLLLTLALLSACGQKGPLFLPGDPSQLQTIPPTVPQAEEADEDEEQSATKNPQ